MQPNYLISQSHDKVVLRNFEGVITSYPEPQNYTPGTAEDYFYSYYEKKQKKRVGISALMNDDESHLVPEGLKRLDRRKSYEQDISHQSLKNQREKRDKMKERKWKKELERMKESEKKEQTSNNTGGVQY